MAIPATVYPVDVGFVNEGASLQYVRHRSIQHPNPRHLGTEGHTHSTYLVSRCSYQSSTPGGWEGEREGGGGRREGGREGGGRRREGGRGGGREGGRERGRDGGEEGGREGRRERGRAVGREGGKEGGREEGGREGRWREGGSHVDRQRNVGRRRDGEREGGREGGREGRREGGHTRMEVMYPTLSLTWCHVCCHSEH